MADYNAGTLGVHEKPLPDEPLKDAYPAGVYSAGSGEDTPRGLPLNANVGALRSSLVAKIGPGRLLGLSAYNSNAATRFVQIFDAGSVPADGAVPLMVWQVPTQSTLSVSWASKVGTLEARTFNLGIVVVNSSTDTTKTLSGSDLLIDVQYV